MGFVTSTRLTIPMSAPTDELCSSLETYDDVVVPLAESITDVGLMADDEVTTDEVTTDEVTNTQHVDRITRNQFIFILYLKWQGHIYGFEIHSYVHLEIRSTCNCKIDYQ